MKRLNKQPSAALYTASDSLLMDECVFSTGNLRGFASPARGLTIVRQGMMFVIRVSKVRRSGKPVSRLRSNQARLRFNQGRLPDTFFALRVLNDTTTMLSRTTTLMRDFLTRLHGYSPAMSFASKGCVRPKCRKSSFGRFSRRNNPFKLRCATSKLGSLRGR